MSENEKLLPKLKHLLRLKRGKAYYASKLNITESKVVELLKELHKTNKKITGGAEELFSSFAKVDIEKGTAESTLILNFEPKDDIELAKLHKINLDKYVITNYWSKQLPNGKFTSSVFSKLKQSKDYTPEDFAKFLENYTSTGVIIPATVEPDKQTVDLEISLADFHLGKRHIDGDNDILSRKERYLTVIANLVEKTRKLYSIDKIVFPISNDFFHTDNFQNQTTNGTPQDVIASYSEEYEHGFDLLVQAISYLKENCTEVNVILVQGNHDRTKSYYLAHALDVYFKREVGIIFDRSDSLIKGIRLGNTFIGYHHGNCKLDDLPLLFATHREYSQMFGEALYREVHTGDKHHYMAKEVKGVRIQQMPSLSGTDRWHADNNFVHSIRAGLGLIYDSTNGKIGEFEFRI